MENSYRQEKGDPWFGSWPPEPRGEEMKTHGKIRKFILNSWVMLVFVLILAFLSHSWSENVENEYWKKVLEEFSIALFTAFILGLTIELSFKLQIAKDVFETSFGYLLNPEIKDEVRWIYSMGLMAEEYEQNITITQCKTNKDLVVIEEMVTRIIRNISNEILDINPHIGIHDLFFKEGKSEIVSFFYTIGIKPRVEIKERVIPENYPCVIKTINQDKRLKPNEKIKITWITKTIGRRNDCSYISFASPTKNPKIIIKIPQELKYEIDCFCRKQDDLHDLGCNTHQLEGVLLPGQAIRVRWWDINDSKKWVSESGLKIEEEPQKIQDKIKQFLASKP
jgi:hypothetical protein